MLNGATRCIQGETAWHDSSFKLKAYVGAVDIELVATLEQAEMNVQTAPWRPLAGVAPHVDLQLRYLLVMLTEVPAFSTRSGAHVDNMFDTLSKRV